MRIDGIIFDSDGTLVDSETLSAQAISGILGDGGVVLPPDQVLERFRGCHFAVFAQDLLGDYPIMDVETFTHAYRQRSRALFARALKPMPGALQVVAGLTIEKSIASNGPPDKLETCLGVTGLLPYFQGRVASAYEVGSWKPDPGLVLHAAAMMQVPPDRCLLVEDSLAGIQAGLAAGVQVVGYRLSAAVRAAVGPRVRVIQALTELPGLIQAGSVN